MWKQLEAMPMEFIHEISEQLTNKVWDIVPQSRQMAECLSYLESELVHYLISQFYVLSIVASEKEEKEDENEKAPQA